MLTQTLKRFLLFVAIAFVTFDADSGTARAEERGETAAASTVMQITVLDPHEKTEEYLRLVAKTIERQHEVAPGIGTRIFATTFAGEETGRLYIVLEYPDMEFMVRAQARLAADAEWDRLRKEVGLATERTLISNSLLVEVTP